MSSSSQSDPMSWSSSEVEEKKQSDDDEERFLMELESLSYDRYLYQTAMVLEDPEFIAGHFADRIFSSCARSFKTNEQLGYPIIKGMDLGSVKHYSYSKLQEFTDNFSKTSFICRTIHGKLFRGTINNQYVIVKTWNFRFPPSHCCYHTKRIHDELIFLRDPEIKSHPNVVKLIGYHCEQRLAVIYEGIRPEHFLDQLQLSDEFKWKDRMKVAIEIGSMLKAFHDKTLVHAGVWPECFMLDEKFRLMAFDFQTYSINLNKLDIYHYSPFCSAADADRDQKNEGDETWSMSDDVFTYGLLLMEFITKEVASLPRLTTWSEAVLCDPPKSVVHKSLGVDEEIGSKISRLAVECLEVKKKAEAGVAVDIGTVVEELKRLRSMSEAVKLENLCELLFMYVKESGGLGQGD